MVLQCRDHGDGTAATRVLQLIQQHNFTNLKFDRHCFSGTLKELENWRVLPRVVFDINFGLKSDNNIFETLVAKIPSGISALKQSTQVLTHTFLQNKYFFCYFVQIQTELPRLVVF